MYGSCLQQSPVYVCNVRYVRYVHVLRRVSVPPAPFFVASGPNLGEKTIGICHTGLLGLESTTSFSDLWFDIEPSLGK